jgi:plastocyanin
MASRVLKPTLIICLAAGIAAGIGLARPDLGSSYGSSSSSAPAVADAGDPPAAGSSDPYGGGGQPATDTGGDTGTDAPAGGTITISDFDFGGETVVAPGATITVSNTDGAPHTVTADDGEFDTGQIAGGESATFTAPTEPGTYEFFCGVHPSMTGSLVVQA